MAIVSWLACRLPERPLHRLAGGVGLVWYLGAPRRRAQARRNLRRIVAALVAGGRASPAVRRTERSRLGMERLVVAAFGHAARYYLEVARAPAYGRERISERIEDRPGSVYGQFLAERRGTGERPGHGVILVGLHFGALEFPAMLLAEAGIRLTVPMEVIANPPLQAYFVRTRSREGLHIIPQEGAHPELLAALERGEGIGLVSDRVVRGRGTPASLFGHPVRLPIGAALLSLETGVPVLVGAVWRLSPGRYAGRMLRLETSLAGERPERIRAFLEAQTEAFESLIAEAPEQWWSVFHPIWPDLEAGGR